MRFKSESGRSIGPAAGAMLLLLAGCGNDLEQENRELKAQLAAMNGARPSGGVAHEAGETTATLYYANGRTAWNGLPKGTVYHDNGRAAYNGLPGGTVYYANGQTAWNGLPGGTAYHANGATMTSTAHGVTVPIGEEAVLTVRADGARLNVLGTSFTVN